MIDDAVIAYSVTEGSAVTGVGLGGGAVQGAAMAVLLCLAAAAVLMWPTPPRVLPAPTRGSSRRFNRGSWRDPNSRTWPGSRNSSTRRRGRSRRASSGRGQIVRRQPLSSRRVLVGAVVVVIGSFLVVLTSWWWAVAGTIAAATGMRLVRRGHEAAQLRADVGAVAAALHALIRELRSGVGPAEAIDHTAEGSSPRIAALLAGVGSTPESASPVRPLLADVQQRLHAGWELSAQYGIPLTAVIAALATDIEDHAQSIQAVAAESAGPAISGYVLAALPVAGIALGIGMGADPLAVLGHSTVGGLLAVTGVALCCAGLVWVDRIARAASDG